MRTATLFFVIVGVTLTCAMMAILSGCRQTQTTTNSSSKGPQIIDRQVTFITSSSGTVKVVTWKFLTRDINHIEKNRHIAEQLLPQVKQHADAVHATTLCIQAVQMKGNLFFHFSRTYGYVWEKNQTGHWVAYTKKTQGHS